MLGSKPGVASLASSSNIKCCTDREAEKWRSEGAEERRGGGKVGRESFSGSAVYTERTEIVEAGQDEVQYRSKF